MRRPNKTSKKNWMSNIKSLGILLIALVVLLSACRPQTQDTPEVTEPPTEPTMVESAPPPAAEVSQPKAAQPLANTPWVLVMYGDPANPTVIEAGLLVTAQFADDGTLSGNSGCNNYSTTYTVSGDQMTIAAPMAATMMACERGMDLEAAYLAALGSVQNYSIDANGNLLITYQGGTLYFVVQRVALENTLWKLTSLGIQDQQQEPVAGANFTLSFLRNPNAPTGALSGTTGCNDYSADYFAANDTMKINPPGATNNANCPAGLPEQETQYYDALAAARNYRIQGDRMQIWSEGSVLNFVVTGEEPQPTPAAGELTPLNGTKWWYVATDTQLLVPGSEITAEFSINEDGKTGMMAGSAGCNSYSANIIGVFNVTPPIATKQLCNQPEGVMQQEAAYLAALETAGSFAYSGDELRINTAQGTLIYSKVSPVEPAPPIEPTAEVTPEPTSEQPVETPSGAPSAIINGPLEGTAGQELVFDGSGSSSDIGIIQYRWDLGDGTVLEGVSVSHAYAVAGQYTVLLTVVDNNGVTGQASIIVTIQ